MEEKIVVCDSRYGNTEKEAEEIREQLGAETVHVGETRVSDLLEKELLVTGTPTHGGSLKMEKKSKKQGYRSTAPTRQATCSQYTSLTEEKKEKGNEKSRSN